VAGILEQVRQQAKDCGEWRRTGKGPHDDLEVRVGYALTNVPVMAFMLDDVTIREVRLTEVEDGWRLMLKGDRSGKPVVAYTYGDTYRDTMVAGLTMLDTGKAYWDHDEYPPKRFAKPTTPLRF
jgi:hypothetical protein